MPKKIIQILLLSIIATALNYAFAYLAVRLERPLYLDTVFTVAAVFSGGLIAGLVTAAFSTAIFGIGYAYKIYCLFGLCSAAVAVLTWLFVRTFPWVRQLRITGPAVKRQKHHILDQMIMLIFFSLVMCALMSVMGGLISVFIQLVMDTPISGIHVETYLKLGLLRQGIKLLPAEILARIPINIIDRIISVFLAYGAALLVRKAVDRLFIPRPLS
jgi:hypothetical protein